MHQLIDEFTFDSDFLTLAFSNKCKLCKFLLSGQYFCVTATSELDAQKQEMSCVIRALQNDRDQDVRYLLLCLPQQTTILQPAWCVLSLFADVFVNFLQWESLNVCLLILPIELIILSAHTCFSGFFWGGGIYIAPL